MAPRNEEGDCLHEDDFRRLESVMEKMFSKMDSFLADMREVMISEAIRQEQINALNKEIVLIRTAFKNDTDNIGAKYRQLSDRVQVISDWRQRFEGGIKVMLAIPIFCTVVTTGIAIYKLLG